MTTNLQSAYNKIISTNWSHTNSFQVRFNFSNTFNNLGIDSAFSATKNSLENNYEEVYINQAMIPALTTSPIENYIDHRYISTMNNFQTQDVTIKFTDHDMLTLYKFFSAYMIAQRDNYPEDYYFTLTLSKLKDNFGETDTDIIQFNNCMITTVSQLDFNNTANGSGVFAEFDITIHTTKYQLLGGNITSTIDV